MVKDNFSGQEEHSFRGIHLIKNDGTVEYYASSKTRKNSVKLKRDRRKTKWTQYFRDEKAKIANKANKK